jgi:ketosteroid isomerase-like protein
MLMKNIVTGIMVMIFSTLTFTWQEKSVSPALKELADSERAFARYSVEHNTRDAFIDFFADDGVNFAPQPVKTRETLSATPPAPSPPRSTLNWAPIYGDISAAGDLGYTTGPFTLEDRTPQKRPTVNGVYFSVWRKQTNGEWKVVMDIGIQTPSAVAPLDAPFVAAKVHASGKRAGEVKPEAAREQLLAREKGFFAAAAQGAEPAYLKYLDGDARMHRQQMMPLVGKSAIASWLKLEGRQMTGAPIDAGVSRAADLAFVYGSYELKPAAAGAKPEKGYYGRVWKQIDGEWRIVAEISNPLPPQQ